ncbi:hypothetical protein [Streptomyces sp. NBC_00015]|uniref:hypothetical protein n=1 Tax=Streptomyces sp. NBC_00015 TaxID=2903611 RepID=UPI00386E464D
MTAEVNDERLTGFLAAPANRTLELSTAVARCTEALGLQHAVTSLARPRGGHPFGLERFADHVIRAPAAGELAPESLRRLIHAILDTTTSRLQDDATILLLEWNPSAPES